MGDQCRKFFASWGTILKMAVGLMALGAVCGFSQEASGADRSVASVSGRVSLNATPVTVPLQPRTAEGSSGSLIGDADRLGPKERIYLVVRGLQTDRQPGVGYAVFLNMPPNTPSNEADRYLVGNFNFFNVRTKGFTSFDVTEAVRAMLKRESRGQTPTITIAPDGSPAADAHPTVGRIELVLQRN